jgi:hypothetical protein
MNSYLEIRDYNQNSRAWIKDGTFWRWLRNPDGEVTRGYRAYKILSITPEVPVNVRVMESYIDQGYGRVSLNNQFHGRFEINLADDGGQVHDRLPFQPDGWNV